MREGGGLLNCFELRGGDLVRGRFNGILEKQIVQVRATVPYDRLVLVTGLWCGLSGWPVSELTKMIAYADERYDLVDKEQRSR